VFTVSWGQKDTHIHTATVREFS